MIGAISVMRLQACLAGFLVLLATGACRDPGSRSDAGGEDALDSGASEAAGTDAAGVGDAGSRACEGVDAGAVNSRTYVDLTVIASGFAAHEGQTVFVVARTNGAGVVASG